MNKRHFETYYKKRSLIHRLNKDENPIQKPEEVVSDQRWNAMVKHFLLETGECVEQTITLPRRRQSDWTRKIE